MRPILYSIIISTTMIACAGGGEETTPVRKDVTETVFAAGILEAKGTYQLTARADGYCQVFFEDGQLVKHNQLLATIENDEAVYNQRKAEALYEISKQNTQENAPSVTQARNSFFRAKQELTVDSLKFERYKSLRNAKSVSESDYENALVEYQNARTALQNAKENYELVKREAQEALIINRAQRNISASGAQSNQVRVINPGRVYKRHKQTGDFVRTGDVIATIGDADVIYAKVNIDEGSIKKVKVGQDAVVQLNINREKRYNGVVDKIYPMFDQSSQSFLVDIRFTDSIQFDIVNTQLQVNIVTDSTKNALLIPRKYLSYGNTVFVKGQKEPVEVKTKYVSTDWVQVLSGVSDSTVIVMKNKSTP